MQDMTQALVDQVGDAREDGVALRIEGGGSKGFIGRSPVGDSLSLTGHCGIVSYDPGELVVTVRAGTPLAEIEAALAENGQVLPFEPPHFGETSTIGGTLACNLSGPARPWAGSGRDMVLGLKLIDGNGKLLSFGGKVMKNVAGYDISRLQCGGFGCFGILTEVSLKVLPKKPAALSLVAPMADVDRAIQLMNRFSARSLPISGAAWFEHNLYIRLEGGASSVNGGVSILREMAPEAAFDEADAGLWTGMRNQSHEYFQTDDPVWRFSIKSTAPHFDLDGAWLIDWAGSQRWLRGRHDLTHLESAAREAGGTVSCFRNGDRAGEVFQAPDQVTRRLYSKLKAAFDPGKIFNPGRLYSWL